MFHSPWYLLLLLAIPILGWLTLSGVRSQGVSFSSLRFTSGMRRSWRERLAWLPTLLSFVALAFMIVAMARPRSGNKKTIVESEGIAIEMVVDRSGSMFARDFTVGNQSVDRLTAIKHVATKFVKGTDQEPATAIELSGRYGDLIGLIVFAGFADAKVPPTLDHRFLLDRLEQVQIVEQREEDGTAIGDAISLALEKLTSLGATRGNKPASKVIILLTDGENTAGELEPIQAAELAKTLGVKIYTIGVGTRGTALVPRTHSFTGRTVLVPMQVTIDEETLKKIAKLTDGRYYRATDTESLEAIYGEINKLEKTKIESHHFYDYRELALLPFRVGSWQFPSLLFIALVLLGVGSLLRHTFLRPFLS